MVSGASGTVSTAKGEEVIRAEANFEEWAIGLPSSRTRLRQFTQEREVEALVGERRVLMRQSWTMRAGGEYALPGEFDQDVYYAVLCLVERRGGMPEDGVVAFTMYELLQVLGRGHGGKDYRQLAESLDRLSATSYRSRSAFYSAAKRRRVTDSFWLFGVTLRETLPGGPAEQVDETSEGPAGAGPPGEGRSGSVVVRFSPHIVESYRAGYLTTLDPETYFRLPSAMARRLYRIVEGGRGGGRTFEAPVTELRDRIPLSPASHAYASQIRRRLDPAHEAMLDAGFLEDVVYLGRGGDQRARYAVSEGHAGRRSRQDVLLSGASPEQVVARERLISEGVEARIADRLLVDHGPEAVIAAADKLAATPAGKVANPAGWLVRAVERGYAATNGTGDARTPGGGV